MIERFGVQSLVVLTIVWFYFLLRYFIGFQVHSAVDFVMVVLGIVAVIGLFLWLTRHSFKG